MPHTAIWKSIAASVLEEIAAGHYRPGDRLPTEAALAQRFGVNRHTVRHAMAELAKDGAVHPRRGAGVFVTARPTVYPIGRRVRFHQNVLAGGQTPSRRIVRLETRMGGSNETDRLRLSAGAMVHVIEGVSLADGLPLAVFRSLFPAERLPGLLAAMERAESITAALAAEGVADYTRAETRLTAKIARGTLALQLQIAEGAAVLRSVAVNAAADGTPVEYGTTWFAGDRVTLTLSPD